MSDFSTIGLWLPFKAAIIHFTDVTERTYTNWRNGSTMKDEVLKSFVDLNNRVIFPIDSPSVVKAIPGIPSASVEALFQIGLGRELAVIDSLKSTITFIKRNPTSCTSLDWYYLRTVYALAKIRTVYFIDGFQDIVEIYSEIHPKNPATAPFNRLSNIPAVSYLMDLTNALMLSAQVCAMDIGTPEERYEKSMSCASRLNEFMPKQVAKESKKAIFPTLMFNFNVLGQASVTYGCGSAIGKSPEELMPAVLAATKALTILTTQFYKTDLERKALKEALFNDRDSCIYWDDAHPLMRDVGRLLDPQPKRHSIF